MSRCGRLEQARLAALLAGLLKFIVAESQTTIAVLVGLKYMVVWAAGMTCNMTLGALKVLKAAVWALLGALICEICSPHRRQRRWYEGLTPCAIRVFM